ncbi:phospholipase A2 group XV-like [Paramacrobiotus metropolitanus]|uniref:phospholipase A2 group XV-like n=1 Tax=Paramacrobiotus metropolitanus TaxID=2943436 RepID=UPI0024462040|nr:phospholipase A2 group XV-like [Paramacrobiotus metropolitanus]XP_055341492.1 phospholipase A2 group XV-like [Paramacrobiotus metropolitanus]
MDPKPLLWFHFYVCLIGVSSAGFLDRVKQKLGIGNDRGSSNSDNSGTRVSQGALTPVIILPGDGGSQLQAWLERTSVRSNICPMRTNGWTHVWADLDMLIPGLVDCWVDNLKLIYNNITRKTSNPEGVRTQVPGFGDTDSIEYLTGNQLPGSKYLAYIVDMLVDNGYKRNVSVRGAPYDFRKAQNEQEEYFILLKKLVEDTYAANGNHKVTLIGHSLGCLFSLYFLNHQTQEWKDKYINAFIGMGGPWGGAVKPIKVIATGDDLDIAIVSRSKIKDILRTNPSVAALLPSDKFWAKNETLIYTPQKVYNLGNLREFFYDLDFPEGWEFYQDTKNLVYDLIPPGVKTYCLSGTGTATPATYVYKEGGFPKKIPMVISEDGDGTVNRRSLDGCERWKGKQRDEVVTKTFPGAGHRQMTRDKQVLDYIREILFDYQING